MFALLIHIYYHDSWDKLFRKQILALESFSPILMINLCSDTPNYMESFAKIKKDFPSAIIITTPNKGKDIGGKLALIHFFLETEQKTEFIVFLHDKMSPYSVTGDQWRNKLFSIIEPQNVSKILKKYADKQSIGIIASKDFIQNEYNDKTKILETTNNQKIKELISLYALNVNNYIFVGGTIFWIRSLIITSFFSRFSALDCRGLLEEGNPMDQFEGTYTHSWERILCWLANNQQYTLKGI